MSLQCEKCKGLIGKISNSPQFNCHDCWSNVTKQLSDLQQKYDRAVEVAESIYSDGASDDSKNYTHEWFNRARKFLKSIEVVNENRDSEKKSP